MEENHATTRAWSWWCVLSTFYKDRRSAWNPKGRPVSVFCREESASKGCVHLSASLQRLLQVPGSAIAGLPLLLIGICKVISLLLLSASTFSTFYLSALFPVWIWLFKMATAPVTYDQSFNGIASMTGVMFLLPTITLALRLLARYRQKAKLGWDDVFAIVAWVSPCNLLCNLSPAN